MYKSFLANLILIIGVLSIIGGFILSNNNNTWEYLISGLIVSVFCFGMAQCVEASRLYIRSHKKKLEIEESATEEGGIQEIQINDSPYTKDDTSDNDEKEVKERKRGKISNPYGDVY